MCLGARIFESCGNGTPIGKLKDSTPWRWRRHEVTKKSKGTVSQVKIQVFLNRWIVYASCLTTKKCMFSFENPPKAGYSVLFDRARCAKKSKFVKTNNSLWAISKKLHLFSRGTPSLQRPQQMQWNERKVSVIKICCEDAGGEEGPGGSTKHLPREYHKALQSTT